MRWEYVKGYPVRRGDIIQYRDVVLQDSKAITRSSHHTSIVRAVNPKTGLPSQVYEQNVNGSKILLFDDIDFGTLKAGWIRIFRAVRRSIPQGTFEYTIVNRSGGRQQVQVLWLRQPRWAPFVDTLGTGSVDSYHTCTVGNYQSGPYFRLGGREYSIADGAGYVIRGTAGAPVIYLL